MPITLTKSNSGASKSGITINNGDTPLSSDQVNSFFKKPQTTQNTQQNQGILGKVGSFAKNLFTGAAKGAASIPVGLGTTVARVESKIPGPVGKFFAGGAQEGENIQNTTLKPQGIAQNVGNFGVNVAALFAQPELELDKIGLSGLTKLAEKGGLSPENFEKIKDVVTSKWGVRGVKAVENFIKGGAYTGVQAASEGKSTGEVGNEALGGGIANVALEPVASFVGNKIGSTLATKTEGEATKGTTVYEKLFGKEAAEKAAAKKDPIAQEFQAGKRTIADTSKKVKSAISSFVKKGKQDLENVFSKLPKDVSVKPSAIVNAVQTGMDKVVSGVEKSSGAELRSINDMLTKTKFSPEEQKVVSNLVDRVKTWVKIPENTSPRGLAELRRVLYNEFNRGDGSISDQVVSKVNTELKNLIGQSSKEYGPALKKAVDNIDKVASSSKEFLDKNGKVVESKLITFARKLKDPALKADAKKVLQETLGDSYNAIIKELQGFNNYETVSKIKDPGLIKKAGVVGGILGGGYGLDKILKGVSGGKLGF